MSEKILPCPFCGEAAETKRGLNWEITCGNENCKVVVIAASDCFDNSVRYWNTRGQPLPSSTVGEAQGRCDVTLTERFSNPTCRCDTYKGNKGPCQRFEEGSNGRCVYCDHTRPCHVAALSPAPPDTAVRSALEDAYDALGIVQLEGIAGPSCLEKVEQARGALDVVLAKIESAALPPDAGGRK